MQIQILVKQLGKKHPVVAKQPLEIEDLSHPSSLRELIVAVVKKQVDDFNSRKEAPELMKYLTPAEIEQSAQTGKVDFGHSHNNEKADLTKAIDTALLAFEDGMYCIFLDDEQIEKLDDTFSITPESTFAFVRLAFLAGSYW